MSGVQCIGPEFAVGPASPTDPGGVQLHFKGIGSTAWPTQAGAASVFTAPANNGLLYDPNNGGLYTAPHGNYRQWLRQFFAGPAPLHRGINQPTAVGTTWTNPALAQPLTFVNPSLAQACSVQWGVSFWVSVSLPRGNQLAHWIGVDTVKQLDQSGCLPAASAANSPASGYDMDQTPWSDERTLTGISLVAPGGTLTVWATQIVTTAAWGAQGSSAPFSIMSASVEWIVEGVLVDPNQAGGVVVQQ